MHAAPAPAPSQRLAWALFALLLAGGVALMLELGVQGRLAAAGGPTRPAAAASGRGAAAPSPRAPRTRG